MPLLAIITLAVAVGLVAARLEFTTFEHRL
jgi:hypothetical protein